MTDTTPTTTDAAPEAKTRMEIGDILKILPHRYPFLLIDRVLELERMKKIVALKNVTITEPFFQGHFPAGQSCQAYLSLKRSPRQEDYCC